jgi:hypothetical protein
MTMVAIRRPCSVAARASDDEEKKGRDERGGISRISRRRRSSGIARRSKLR